MKLDEAELILRRVADHDDGPPGRGVAVDVVLDELARLSAIERRMRDEIGECRCNECNVIRALLDGREVDA